MASERKYGRVIWFKNEKGFGFLRPDGASEDEELFFHYSHIAMEGYKTIKGDTRVSFEIGKNHMGPMAVMVQTEPDIESSDETEEG
jgi:CspA family cold shock protein